MTGVTLEKVVKKYGDVQVIHGVDLKVEDGEFCVFVGPSGCGKSTLLRMIAGLEETTGGTMRIGTRGRPADCRGSADTGPEMMGCSAMGGPGLVSAPAPARPDRGDGHGGGVDQRLAIDSSAVFTRSGPICFDHFS